MSFAATILPEIDHEMANTRKALERIPAQKLEWKPHPKSHTIGRNANHLADLPSWGVRTLTQSQFNLLLPAGRAMKLQNWQRQKRSLN